MKYGPPILLVPSVVSRSYVFDLHSGNSFVERLLAAGFDVYLVDWGVAGKEESTNTFETYVDELMPLAVAAACEDAGSDDLTMLGYCFSGLLTMLYLAGHPDAPIRSLVSLAPPIDYAASAGITKVFAEGRLEPEDILDEDGNVPGDVVREAFAMRKPTVRPGHERRAVGQPLEGRLRRGPPGDGAVHPRAGADARRAAAPDRRQADPRQRARHRRHGAERPARASSATSRARCWSSWPSATSSSPWSRRWSCASSWARTWRSCRSRPGHVGLITGRKAATVTIPHILGWIADHSQSLQESEVES